MIKMWKTHKIFMGKTWKNSKTSIAVKGSIMNNKQIKKMKREIDSFQKIISNQIEKWIILKKIKSGLKIRMGFKKIN